MATLSTDKLIEEHFTPPTQEELEGMPTPSGGGGPSDLIKPAANLTEPDLDPEQEIVEERTERTKTYDLGNGKYRTVGSPVKAHYEEEGQFKELDLTIEEKSDRFELVQEGGSSNAPYELNIRKGMIGYGVSHKQGGQVHLKLDQLGNRPLNPKFIQNNVSITVGGNVIVWRIDSLDLSLRVVARPEKVELYKTLETDQAPRSFKWTVAEEKNNSARFTFNPHGAAGQDNTGDRLELNESRSTIDQDDTFEYSEYVEEFTGRAAKIDDPETRSRSWKSAEYPVEIDPSASVDVTANIDDVNATQGGALFDDAFQPEYLSPAYVSYAGVRFRSLPITQGVSVDSATLEAYVQSAYDINVRIYADDVDNAPKWSSNDLPQDINRSSNYYEWQFYGGETGNQTAQITGQIQEIINRGGWSSGNNIRHLLSPYSATTAGNKVEFDDYSDTDPDVATLSVTWSEPTTVSTITGTVTAQDASVSGSLSSPATVTGSVQAQDSSITSTASTLVSVSGTVSSQSSTASGNISTAVHILGTVQSNSSTTGSVSTIGTVGGSVSAQSVSVNGSLISFASISGTVSVQDSSVSGTLSSLSSISGTLTPTSSTTGSLTTTATITGSVQATGGGALGTTSAVSVLGKLNPTVSAQDPTTTGSISAVATVGGSVSAQTVDITSSLSNISTVKGGVSAGQSAIDGSLSSISTITGTSTASEASVSGTLSFPEQTITGTVQSGTSTTSGNLKTVASTSGTASSGNSSITSTVSNLATVSGSVRGSDSSVTGSVSAPGSASGTVSSQDAGVAGSISTTVTVSGSVSGQSSTTGSISTLTPLSGSVSGTSSSTGSISTTTKITGTASSQDSTSSGSGLIIVSVSGTLTSQQSTVSGAVRARYRLSGQLVSSDSSVGGSLSALASITGTPASQKSSTSGSVSKRLGPLTSTTGVLKAEEDGEQATKAEPLNDGVRTGELL